MSISGMCYNFFDDDPDSYAVGTCPECGQHDVRLYNYTLCEGMPDGPEKHMCEQCISIDICTHLGDSPD